MRKTARCICLALSSVTLVLALSSSAVAAPSDLDPLFGGTGTLTTGIAPADNLDQITALSIQPDGKIVTAGVSNMGAGVGGNQFALARYNSDGSLDTSFDSDGKLTTGIAPVDNLDQVTALSIQPDGKVVAAGWADMGAGLGGIQFALARYNTDGSLDTSFDSDGKLTTGIAPTDNTDVINAVSVQPDNKIVTAGYAYMGVGLGGYQFALARYNANGSLDASFDGDGKLTTGIAPTDGQDAISALSVQPGGKIVTAGKAYLGAGAGGFQFALARYNANGSLDTSFDADGKLTTGIAPIDNDDVISALSVQPDGKIVTAGHAFMGAGAGGNQFALARYNTDGSLDTGFDADGKQTTGIAPADNTDQMYALSIQPNGKIVTAGFAYMGTGAGGYQFALARYTANGSLDTSFDTDGKLTAGIAPSDNDDLLGALGIQPDGKIVTAGYAYMGTGSGGPQFALARYMGDPPPPAAPAPAAPATPTAKITRPAHRRIRSKALKVFAGTAGPAGQVAKVEIALRRVDRRQLKRGRCLWLRNSKAKFIKTKAQSKRCAKQRFLLAKGTDKWSFKLRARLPKARYELYARVTLKTGERHTTFTKTQGNLLAFRVI